jgi:hypothetical protein
MGDSLILAYAEKVYALNRDTLVFTYIDDMLYPPIGSGTVHRNTTGTRVEQLAMYVPCLSGYSVIYDDSGWTVDSSEGSSVDFAVYDDKVFRLTSHQLLYRTAQEAAWTDDAIIPNDSIPRRLVAYLDRSDNPALYVITNDTVFAHDFTNHLLHQTDLEYPKHPYQGLAAVKHQTDLWVSVGVGAHRYTRDAIIAAGLDGGDGMPERYRGYIVDMASSYNGLFALVRGQPVVTEGSGSEYDLDVGGVDPFTVPSVTSSNVLMYYNGQGWRQKAEWDGAAPTSLFVSQDPYAVYFGDTSGTLHKIPLSLMYYSSRYSVAPFDLEPEAVHETGWYNWGRLGADEIAKQIEVKTSKISQDCTIQVSYKIDADENPWVTLPLIDDTTPNDQGEVRFYLGLDPTEPTLRDTSRGKYRGVRHRRIKLRFILRNDGPNPRLTPVLEWHQVVARRWLRPQRTWRIALDLTKDAWGWTPEQQENQLFNTAVKQEAVVFQHQHGIFMAELVAIRAQQAAGGAMGGMYQIDLIAANDLDSSGNEG